MTAPGPAAAITSGVGKRAANSGQTAATRGTWVWWSITSDRSTSHRSRVARQASWWRPWRAYQEPSKAALLPHDDRHRRALGRLAARRRLRRDQAHVRWVRRREACDHVE